MSGCPGLLVGLVQRWARPEEPRRPANTKNQSVKAAALQQNRAVSFHTEGGSSCLVHVQNVEQLRDTEESKCGQRLSHWKDIRGQGQGSGVRLGLL